MRDFTGNKPIKPLRTHLWGWSGDTLSLIATIMPPPKPAKTHLRKLVGSSSNISFKIKELHLAMGMIGFLAFGSRRPMVEAQRRMHSLSLSWQNDQSEWGLPRSLQLTNCNVGGETGWRKWGQRTIIRSQFESSLSKQSWQIIQTTKYRKLQHVCLSV